MAIQNAPVPVLEIGRGGTRLNIDMKVTYDESLGILYIGLRDGDYESDEIVPSLIVDFDRSGKPMAIEVLNASNLMGRMDRIMLEYERIPQAV